MKITINTTKIETDKTELTYQEIVDLADSGRSKQALHTIVYRVRGPKDWERSGTITPGQKLELAENMNITALVTDNA
jgi:hypothetical protein